MPERIHPDVEREVRRLAAKGHKLREIGRMLGYSRHAVTNTLRREQLPVAPVAWSPASGRLSLDEREEIRVGIEHGDTFTAIAARLGRAVSTVSRQVNANGGRASYRAHLAHQRAFEQSRRPKTPKLACERLAVQVAEWLEEWWSPEEISARLRMEFPDDPMMWVSHETIYMSLFVEGRGQLRRELSRCLRTGRAQRRPRSRIETRGKIPGMVMISERPAEAEDRAVPGHWEGDLIIGEGNRSAVGTLVERASRYVMLLHLPDGRNAEKVNEAMTNAIMELPETFRRTITWDQGREMSAHARFTIDTGIQIYFCDPHSPWQRPSNENTNGLLRQYMPKGTDLSVHSVEDLGRYAMSLNNRPRKALGFMKPSEKFAELLALTG
jgi:transposase, IS30 family